MEGLEISEVIFSKVDLGDRFDAEYFWKDSLHIQELLEQKGAVKFNEIGDFVASAFYPAATHLYESGDTPFIRCVDCIKYPLITKEQNDSFEKIPLSFANESGGINFLKKGDLVITKVGSPCYTSIIEGHELVALSRTVLGVKNINDVDSYYLLVFLRSRYGFNQLLRQRELTIQYQLTLARVKEIQIYIAGVGIQQKIHDLISHYIQKNQQSKTLYAQAEALLLNAIGMADFSPSTEKVNIKSFKDSFVATGRLDAEYYQPKFDELEAEIAKTHELARLKDFLTLNQRGTQPCYAEQGLPVINSKHVREGEVLLTDNRFAALSEKEQPLFIKKGDVLINGTGVGTIGRSACYLHEQNALPDNHVTILRTDKINPVYLSVYLNSIAGKYQVDKYFKGSSGQIELYPKDIENFYIPVINEDTQTQIAALVQQSFTLKAESERLLETAKRAVEIAIEENEDIAMAYLNKESHYDA